ncbi:hypothetical protein [Nostoc mirabile]|uniref:hypothetical protein n=1 Tax=Nostoc mirabile TaxID=2907820 RepID=UPI001E5A989A|nr:hypothetical protein [Nostoc mirabile]
MAGIMKSTKRPPKPQQPKLKYPSSKPEQIPAANQSEGESLNVTDEPIELTQDAQEAINITLLCDRSSADNSSQPFQGQRTSKPRVENSEYSERFQHVRFLDCDKAVRRIIFECWYCQQGILCEFTGEPVVGEYNGRPSIIQIKVKCPDCEQTAIRLSTGEVLSTTAIPSPWR